MDFAQLGIKLDTSNLERGLQQLKQLQPTGINAAAAADKLGKTLARTALAQERLSISTAKATKATAMEAIASGNLSKVKIQEQRAIIKAANAQIKASKSKIEHIKQLRDEISLQKQLTSATNAATAATAKNDAALIGVTSGFGVSNRPANDMIPNRFNTANIAAQFQDIGVTASMGMNPLTIAIQQGTQLSAVLQTMESPLKGIAVAFRQILNPVALMSIVLVAVVAAGIQFVDWTAVAKSSLNGLANIIEMSADALIMLIPIVLATGAAFLAWKLPAIITSLTLMTKAVWAAVAAQVALVASNPAVLLVAGYAVVAASAAMLGNEIAKIFGTDLFTVVKKSVNTMIAFFEKSFTVIKEILSLTIISIGIAIAEMFNIIAKGVTKSINFIITNINKIRKDKIELIEFDGIDAGLKARAENAANIIKTELNTGLSDVDYIGIVGNGIQSVTSDVADRIRKLADGLGKSEDTKTGQSKAEKDRDNYEDLIATANRRIETLKLEQTTIGMTEQASNRLRIENELLNRAAEQGIKLSNEQIDTIRQIASETAALEDQNRRLNESYNFLRDTGKGFFQDIKSGIMEGKNLWESFADSVINVLNRIADRLLDVGLNSLFDGLSGGGGQEGGGFLGSIGSSLAGFLTNAKGNAYSPKGIEQYAKGGTFTNSVVSSPTMFSFAKGGKFGVMGEAGPEAIMPLHRGPDGSLGVKMTNGSSQEANSTVINIDARGAEQGVEEKIRAVMNEVMTLRKEVPAIAVSSVSNANKRNSRYL